MWNQVEAKKNKEIELLQKADVSIEGYRKGTAHLRFVSSSGQSLPDVEVNVMQKTQNFLFGNLLADLVRIGVDDFYQPDLYKQRFLELFNLGVVPFFWYSYEKTPGMTEWRKLIPVLEWCRANGVTVKGHPLVWPSNPGIPEWLYDMPEGSVEALTQARVINIVKGFQPYIQFWDVANEAVNHISWEMATRPAFRESHKTATLFLSETPINQAADWVEKSFRWAYAANPKATLILNDYNQESDPHIRQRFYDLVKKLQSRHVPISGLGLQMHPLNDWLWPHEIWETLEKYAELHIPIHITELHQPANSQEIKGGWRQGLWTVDAQAEFVEQVYRLCFSHPSVVSINYWGLSDRNIWYKGGGLIDEEYRPKPVFEVLKKLIKGTWFTPPLTLRADSNGRLSFRGFLGQYNLVIKRPERKDQVETIHLAQEDAKEMVVSIND